MPCWQAVHFVPKRLSGWHEGISAQWGGGRPPTSHHMSPSPTHHSVLSMRIEACVPQPLCLLSPRSPASPMALRPRFSHHRMKRLHQSEFPVPLLRPTSLGSHLPVPSEQAGSASAPWSAASGEASTTSPTGQLRVFWAGVQKASSEHLPLHMLPRGEPGDPHMPVCTRQSWRNLAMAVRAGLSQKLLSPVPPLRPAHTRGLHASLHPLPMHRP